MCANIPDLHLAVKSDVEADYETSDFTNPMKKLLSTFLKIKSNIEKCKHRAFSITKFHIKCLHLQSIKSNLILPSNH